MFKHSTYIREQEYRLCIAEGSYNNFYIPKEYKVSLGKFSKNDVKLVKLKPFLKHDLENTTNDRIKYSFSLDMVQSIQIGPALKFEETSQYIKELIKKTNKDFNVEKIKFIPSRLPLK